MRHKITKTSIIVKKNSNLPSESLGEELVIFDAEGGNYINLNKTGNIIWQFIEPPISVESLVGRLVEKYKIDSDTCTFDTIEYLEQIYAINLIQIA